ncbi:MAG: helix-turn-helix transcriptional regulator [Deltaproteobacteria bacterium]|jgi:transcriptional regulator with XRE-family HTH domain|nr:helix-turn-helix transcriptional regulator [Deltaproteobacteria bacterium]
MEQDVAFVGKRVRQWREEMGLSLQELAARCDVAASTIQKVETGQMVPSIAIALKIARGLDRRPAELLSSEPEEAEVVLMRAKEHVVIDSHKKLRVERLSGDLFDPAIEMWRVTVHPSFSSGSRVHEYDGEEVIVLEAGELHFEVGGEEYVLGEGDTLHFKAGIPHRWWNSSRRIARFLIAGNFPRGLRRKLHMQVQKDRGGAS